MDDHLDELFAAPLDRYIEVRGDIVRRLKSEGSTEAAAAVAAIRKPSVSVWVVNQLARSAGADLADLAEAGTKLEAVQRGAMNGGPVTGYQEARAQEAAAIARLEKAARRVMPSITAQTQDRVLTTLRSGAASTEGRAMLAAGRLVHDLEPSGFELFSAGLQPQPPQPLKPSRAEEAAHRKLEALRSKAHQAQERAIVASADAQRASDEAEMAARRALKARAEATSAAQRAEAARSEADRLAEQLTRAEAERGAPQGS
ncbi:MAG: hypothetical protein ACFCVC_13290 [Acidimicrobiia bacterium]